MFQEVSATWTIGWFVSPSREVLPVQQISELGPRRSSGRPLRRRSSSGTNTLASVALGTFRLTTRLSLLFRERFAGQYAKSPCKKAGYLRASYLDYFHPAFRDAELAGTTGARTRVPGECFIRFLLLEPIWVAGNARG